MDNLKIAAGVVVVLLFWLFASDDIPRSFLFNAIFGG